MLKILQQLPDILSLPAERLHEKLDGPTLIHLSGRRPEPLFVSVLLHGNEDSGYMAVQDLLKTYKNKVLPRSISVFIGNIHAAKHRKRHLDHQPDYNRVWLNGESPEALMMERVIEEMRQRNVFASVDIHNNTGINPHYSCVTKLNQKNFHLATLFSRTIIYFTTPEGTQTSAFADICPSVTVECGKPGQLHGEEHAFRFLDACLHLDHFPDHPVHHHDMELYHTVAVVRVPQNVSFSFESDSSALRLRSDLDHLNFTSLTPGTILGHTRSNDIKTWLEAINEDGDEVTEKYFTLKNNAIQLKQEVMPSMLTLNKEIIRQDCLGYFMERYNGFI